MKIQHAVQLGATMYTPATNSPEKLLKLITGQQYSNLRSLVICLEDAVLEKDIHQAMINLKDVLTRIKQQRIERKVALFIRPRNLEVAKAVMGWGLQSSFDGVVIPKFTIEDCERWCSILPSDLALMPTFETGHYFDAHYRSEALNALRFNFHKILCLRVGGNDLMSCLNLRRPKNVTIYETPVGFLLNQIIGEFVPYGFSLSSPVFEHFADTDLMKKELEKDVVNGLFTKTAIHPSQIDLIHSYYSVSATEYEEAELILNPHSNSVFKSGGSMLEPATHRNWAKAIMMRAEVFGVKKAKEPFLKIIN